MRSRRFDGGGRSGFPLGQYSDDTQLARELARSLVSAGKLDPNDYAHRIAALFTEGHIVGRGRATESAALRLAAGVSWLESGAPAPSAGNGSAMRAAPIGLLFRDDPVGLVAAARDQGYITHQDARCAAGAIVIAGAAARASRESWIDPLAFCLDLARLVESVDVEMPRALLRLPSLIERPTSAVIAELKRLIPVGPSAEEWPGISPFVSHSVLFSLVCFLQSPRDFWEVIARAIENGGDVDTTAAMAGAISGAHLGLAGMSGHEQLRVTDRGAWGHEALTGLAHELASLYVRKYRRPGE